jgi:hypothetical protein
MYIIFFVGDAYCTVCVQPLELEAGPHSEWLNLGSRTV